MGIFSRILNWFNRPIIEINILTHEASVPVSDEHIEKIACFVRTGLIEGMKPSEISDGIMCWYYPYGIIMDVNHRSIDITLL